jgi:hypothetical protein
MLLLFGLLGATVSAVSAQVSVVLDDASVAATGAVRIGGEVSVVLDDASVAATGAVRIGGEVSVVLDDASVAATGAVKFVVTAYTSGTLLSDGVTLGDLSSDGITAGDLSSDGVTSGQLTGAYMGLDFTIARGDTGQPLDFTLFPETDLTGATAVFRMFTAGTDTVVLTRTATITQAAKPGKVRHIWQESDTPTMATFDAEFRVTFADGTVVTYPNGPRGRPVRKIRIIVT